jgi:hypothetical protein
MGKDDIEVPNRGVDGSSRPRRACYPWGNFSVTMGPQRRGHHGSLGPAFTPGALVFKAPVRRAFGLALITAVLTRLSPPLGPLDIFSRGGRPSRTAHLSVSLSRERLARQPWVAGVTLLPPPGPETWVRRLPATLCTHSRIAATGCSKAPQGLLSPTGVGGLFIHLVASPGCGRGQHSPR